uniref:Uncharacterized protein n=1 Tax=Anguilla anguilla TaxID=7936 RepID=A0A0E9WCK7_ANGAN
MCAIRCQCSLSDRTGCGTSQLGMHAWLKELAKKITGPLGAALIV